MWWCSQNNWDLKSLIPGDDDNVDVDLYYVDSWIYSLSIYMCDNKAKEYSFFVYTFPYKTYCLELLLRHVKEFRWRIMGILWIWGRIYWWYLISWSNQKYYCMQWNPNFWHLRNVWVYLFIFVWIKFLFGKFGPKVWFLEIRTILGRY